jgi:hypothetical protein
MCAARITTRASRSSEYIEHYHRERNHQGVRNRLLMPTEQAVRPANSKGGECRE